MPPVLLHTPLPRRPPHVSAASLHARLAQLAELAEQPAAERPPEAAAETPISPATELLFWSFSPSPPGSPTGSDLASAAHSPALPKRPERVSSPTFDDARRRRHGMAHGDNTTGAFRYAKPLGAEFAAAHAGHFPHTHAAAGPGVEASWPRRLTMGLPLQLVPLVGSLPALVNNMRHAQRSVVWWRYFSALDRQLAAQLRKDRPGPAPAPSPGGCEALLAQWRSSKACERLAVRMALCEARFNLSFNAVELLSYAAGLLQLVLGALSRGKAAVKDSFAAKALALLLLASGLLHVAQRASWFLVACQVRQAVAEAKDLSEAVADLLAADTHAACRFHGLQLGFWSAFSLGLLAASGALAGLGLGPVAGAVLVVASMVGAKIQRLFAPRRFDVPDSAIWEVDEGVRQLPSLHRLRTFAAPARQAAALLSYREQALCLHEVEAQVLTRHTTPWRAWILRTLLFFHEAPGAAALLGVLSGRWFRGPGQDPATTLLAGYCRFWRAQAKLVEEEKSATRACLVQLEAACGTAAKSGPLAEALCTLRAEQQHAKTALDYESARLAGSLAAAESWLLAPPPDQGVIWEALHEIWRLDHGAVPKGAGPKPVPQATFRPAVGAVLLEARKHLEDWQTSLVWGAKLGCLQRSARSTRPWH